MLQPERGQVKIGAYANSGLLTVHVIQARNLQSKWQEKCNGFLKVTLHPEDEDPDEESPSNKCRTDIIQHCNQPQFDEKFSFELLEEDLKRRILISAWHHEEDTGHNEFLGCMSFGIQHIVSKRRMVNGWYYLLTEKLGKRKHLQVNSQRNTDYASSIVPEVTQDLAWMEPCVFVLKKDADEHHGIEVSGAFPAIVHTLHRGSPGESIGLQPGDRIVRINGFNVSRSTEESVSRILRTHETQIILEIQRPSKRIRGPPVKQQPKPHHTSLDIQQALDTENYMDHASLMQARFNSELNIHQRSRLLQNTTGLDNPAADCYDHTIDSQTCCGSRNVPCNDLGQSTRSVNHRLPAHGRQPFSQCNDRSNLQDGYYSEGQPMKIRPRSSSMSQHLESGYMSETQSMRRTSTRTSSFRDNGYYSEGQPMRRPKLQALQEEESGYFNEANTIPDSCCSQQQKHYPMVESSSSSSRGKTANCSRRQSVGVTANMVPPDGYCSEGQPRKRGSRMISHGTEEGYYSESQAMRMRPRPSGSVCNNSMAQQQQPRHREVYQERLYPQGMVSQDVYEEHKHEQGCPMHLSQHHHPNQKNLQIEEHLYHQQENQNPSTKRDKVSAWLDNIPHPKEMHHDPSVPNPFPELTDSSGQMQQRPKPVGCAGKFSLSHKDGLDPIYEEPEITSISMLLEKRKQLKQLEPIPEEMNKENAKPQHLKKGTGGAASLFGLCGGIASKKKKKDKAIKL